MNGYWDFLTPGHRRPRRRYSNAIILLVVGLIIVLVGGLLIGRQFTTNGSTTIQREVTSLIAEENSQSGTATWIVSPSRSATTQIQAYAGVTSVQPGQQITFYVSVQHDNTPYWIDIYRLGWYGSGGGRLMATAQQTGQAQGYFDETAGRLVDCPTCTVDTKLGLVETGWQPSYTLTVPSSWVTGVYEAKFTDASGWQTFVPFDVRGNAHSTYLVVTDALTTAAYNHWGGYSLYQGPNGTSATRGYTVSLSRPTSGWGSGQGLRFEISMIRWLEQHNYDVSYMSDVDMHEHPELLRDHRAVLFLGHSEYWSKQMRDGTEAARDAGVGLAFMSADDAAWQIRFEADRTGTPDRTIVCYKDANLDPLHGVDDARLTVQWRDPPVRRPENALIGIMFSTLTQDPNGFPWQLSDSATSPLLTGTSLRPRQPYGCDLVGYEWDEVSDNGHTPVGVQILGESKTVDIQNKPSTSYTTYYIAGSGAMVFAAGSIQWTYALDSLRLATTQQCSDENVPVPGIQKLMENVMDALAVKHEKQ